MTGKVKKLLYPWAQWRNKQFWILAIVLLWTLFGFLGVPYLVNRILVETIQNNGRSIDIAEIQTNPFTLSLTVRGLEVRDPDGTVITRFEEFFANFQLSSLFYRAWTFADLRLVGLHVEEERFDDGDTRWSRFVGDLKLPQEQQSVEQEDKTPPRAILHHLVIEEGSIGVTDHLAGGFHSEFGPVSVDINNLRTLPNHVGENEVSIVTPAGGVISWKGDLQIVPLASSGHFRVRGKGLPAALRYADQHLPIGVDGESLELDFDYELEMTPDGLRARGKNMVTRTGRIHAWFDDSGEEFASVSGLVLEGGSWQLPERRMQARSFSIDGAALDLSLDEDGRLNLLDVVPQPASGDSKPAIEDVQNASKWVFDFDAVTASNSTIRFEDLRPENPGSITVENLQIGMKNADNLPDTAIASEISGELASGGSYSYTGDLSVLPSLEVRGALSINDLALPVIQPWLAEIAKIEMASGRMNLEAKVSGELPASLILSGSTSLSDVEVRDTRRNQRLASLDELEIEQFEFDTKKQSVQSSTIILKGAFGRVHIFEDLSTNIGDLAIQAEPAEATVAQESSSSEFDLSIAGVVIEDSSLDFADDSLPLPFQALIGDLNGNLSILSNTSSEPTRVDLEGQVNEFGQANISGILSPMDFSQNTDIDIVFRNLEMSNLTPYTVQYAGYTIESGRLEMDLGYQFQQRQLEGENNIVIRQLELGEKIDHPDAASLPLKLAVALLKDSEGVIDVDLPVSGNLDDPEFKIGGVIWKALGNLLTRIVTSPFRFLGNLVGVDSEDFGTLEFQPGEPDVSPPDREQLLKLAEAMAERPELELTVTGVFVEELDVPALQALALEAQLETTRAALLESGDADVLNTERRALESLFLATFPEMTLESAQAEFSTPPGEDASPAGTDFDEPAYLGSLRTRLIESQNIDDEQLKSLAVARAEAIVNVLHTAGSNAGSISVAGVEAGESEEGAILLELGVTVEALDD